MVKILKKLLKTQSEVNVDDDGLVTVAGLDALKCEEAVKLVEAITFEPEVGMEFEGKVTRLMAFGAFVEFAPGREGLVHISELEWHRVDKVEDVCSPGDVMKIKLMKIDDQVDLILVEKLFLKSLRVGHLLPKEIEIKVEEIKVENLLEREGSF